ncbi:MAG: NUDIX domain-containing protein [Sciscionella sp.]
MVQGARTGGQEDQPMVSSVYLVHAGRVLLVLHSGFGRWVPPGGHMERGETPSEAACREASEETGLDIELVSASPVIHAKDDNATPDITPFYCDLLTEGFARPVAVQYYWGRLAGENQKLRHQVSEVDGAAWITLDELAALPTFDQVRSLAAFALQHHPDIPTFASSVALRASGSSHVEPVTLSSVGDH